MSEKTIKRYKAYTESGAQYLIDFEDRWWFYDGSSGSVSEPLSSFKVIDRATVTSWDDIRNAPEATEPVVGKSIYVHGGISGGVWRLSTPIASVEEWVYEDD